MPKSLRPASTCSRKTDARLAEVYAARSGRTPEEFTLLMAENNGSGRWLSAGGTRRRTRRSDHRTRRYGKTPAAQATPAGQWRKLLGKLGLVRPADALPPDRNILHFGDPEKGPAPTSELALHEGQHFAAPTRTLPAKIRRSEKRLPRPTSEPMPKMQSELIR